MEGLMFKVVKTFFDFGEAETDFSARLELEGSERDRDEESACSFEDDADYVEDCRE